LKAINFNSRTFMALLKQKKIVKYMKYTHVKFVKEHLLLKVGSNIMKNKACAKKRHDWILFNVLGAQKYFPL
jgi:hypothetical protein